MFADRRPIIRSLAVISLSCLLMLPVGCKDKTPDNAKANASNDQDHLLSLTLDWRPEPEFGGFYQAKIGDSFKKRGINIELKHASGPVSTWQRVANEQTDFATTSADQVLVARANDADVVALFAVYQTSPQGIMVHAASGFSNIKDVFTNSGTLAAEMNPWLKFLLKKYPDSVVKIVSYPGGIGNFLARPDYSQQCFITAEPLQAIRQGSDPKALLIADEGFNPYVTVLITNGKTLREKPEMVSKVVAACKEGWRAYLDNPTAANKEMGSLNHEMDAQTFIDAAAEQKRLIETPETRKNGLGTMTLERWTALRQQLIDVKTIDAAKAPSPESCFVNPK